VTLEEVDEMVKLAKGESDRYGHGHKLFYAWNRVLHALWNVRDLMPVRSELRPEEP
jgi:hypothetical protein